MSFPTACPPILIFSLESVKINNKSFFFSVVFFNEITPYKKQSIEIVDMDKSTYDTEQGNNNMVFIG